MLETELKAIITRETFDQIAEMFQWDKKIVQINSYYTDKNGYFHKNGITMRIRTSGNSNKLQIKKHINKTSALHTCEESEFDIHSIPEKIEDTEVKKYTGISETAYLLGSLTTTRYSFMYTDKVEICLDESKYLGVCDYEIEIEFIGNVPEELIRQLADNGVTFGKKSIGKYSRFVNRLSNIANKKS